MRGIEPLSEEAVLAFSTGVVNVHAIAFISLHSQRAMNTIPVSFP